MSVDYPTTPEEALRLSIADKFEIRFNRRGRGEIREFTAIALTDAVPLSREQQRNYTKNGPIGAIDAATIGRYIIKAMIVGNANGDMLKPIENPHRFLIDPCGIGETPDLVATIKMIKMFTTYVTSEDFSISSDSIVRRGDKVRVTMTVDSRGNIHTDHGEIIQIVSKAKYDPFLQNLCESLQGKFDTSELTLLADHSSGPVTTKCSLSGKASHRTAADLMKAYGLSQHQADGIVKVANNISANFDPGWLANIINGESGFDPQEINIRDRSWTQIIRK